MISKTLAQQELTEIIDGIQWWMENILIHNDVKNTIMKPIKISQN